MKLSVVVPIYNEEKTVEACLDRVFKVVIPGELEVLAVNDGSKDRSAAILEAISKREPRLRVINHPENRGKGAALKTGFQAMTGDIAVIQDADLEYDPSEFAALIAPIVDKRADVVYGSRFLAGPHRVHLFSHYLGNRFLTFVSNLFTGLNLTDMETGYKVFRAEVVKRLDLKSRGFNVEPEMTAKVAKMKARVYEMAISYHGRDFDEGKKINWTHGFGALWAIVRFNLFGGKAQRLDR